jgi:two-component system alkaline phosphatase synthesis response regulator PhoP
LSDFIPHAVILDIMLPDISGLDILRELRGRGATVPILMLTAKGDVVDRVVGLELGADDYLPKPFAVRELLARVRALIRRIEAAPAGEAPATLSLGGIEFDFRSLTASTGKCTLNLTTHDILVLKVLAARPGEAIPRLDIVEEVCGLDSDSSSRTVDNHVVALRKAIGDDPRRPRHLQTVRGVGYRLVLT